VVSDQRQYKYIWVTFITIWIDYNYIYSEAEWAVGIRCPLFLFFSIFNFFLFPSFFN
jgi:hypothetical protein